jgi:hypothetical protein
MAMVFMRLLGMEILPSENIRFGEFPDQPSPV